MISYENALQPLQSAVDCKSDVEQDLLSFRRRALKYLYVIL
jgi:hypothetical protein